MILIDKSYFIGELSLPNIQVSIKEAAADGVALALQTVGENDLDVFINKYVLDYLTRLLGRELTVKFLQEIETETPSEIWVNLRDKLLINTGTYKASPIANYVYYWVMRDARTKTTQGGEADPNFDFADNVNNQYKLVKAWNDMSEMTVSFYKWFCKNNQVYREYTGCNTDRNICSITQHINTFGI